MDGPEVPIEKHLERSRLLNRAGQAIRIGRIRLHHPDCARSGAFAFSRQSISSERPAHGAAHEDGCGVAHARRSVCLVACPPRRDRSRLSQRLSARTRAKRAIRATQCRPRCLPRPRKHLDLQGGLTPPGAIQCSRRFAGDESRPSGRWRHSEGHKRTCDTRPVRTYRVHDTTGDDLGLIEHPAPNVEPGDVLALHDGREALVTARVESKPGRLAALLEVAVARKGSPPSPG